MEIKITLFFTKAEELLPHTPQPIDTSTVMPDVISLNKIKKKTIKCTLALFFFLETYTSVLFCKS